MKKIILFFTAILMLNGLAYAEPQRLQIKTPDRKIKEHTAQAQLKTVQLSAIEDPEARKAIREILNFLNLQAQK